MNTIQTEELTKLMQLANQKHWGFRVSTGKGIIDHPVYKNQWWYLPVKEDEEIIHRKAKVRLDAIRRSGVKIKGLVLGHEAPKLLMPPPKPKVQTTSTPKTEVDLSFVPLLFLYLLVAPLTMIDPALFIVLSDGTWVEVLSWLE